MSDSGQSMAVKQDPLIGQLFEGKYEIISIIGQGGMGVVYKARHVHMDKFVAIKMLVSGSVLDQRGVLRFKQEARAASNLTHPNIIAVHDFGVSSAEQAYLVMEFLSGRTLEDVIVTDDPMSPARFERIFSQVCRGMQHAHKKGCVHRDLKPSNLMLIDNDEDTDLVKILDFGLAKPGGSESGPQQQLTKSGMVVGSPPFMSPEQCKGETVDFRSDIYSLGCVMYATLTGEVPLMGTNTMSTLFKQITDVPQPMSAIAPHRKFLPKLEQLIMRTLEKDPDSRPQSMAELGNEIADAINSSSTIHHQFTRTTELAESALGADQAARPVGLHPNIESHSSEPLAPLSNDAPNTLPLCGLSEASQPHGETVASPVYVPPSPPPASASMSASEPLPGKNMLRSQAHGEAGSLPANGGPSGPATNAPQPSPENIQPAASHFRQSQPRATVKELRFRQGQNEDTAESPTENETAPEKKERQQSGLGGNSSRGAMVAAVILAVGLSSGITLIVTRSQQSSTQPSVSSLKSPDSSVKLPETSTKVSSIATSSQVSGQASNTTTGTHGPGNSSDSRPPNSVTQVVTTGPAGGHSTLPSNSHSTESAHSSAVSASKNDGAMDSIAIRKAASSTGGSRKNNSVTASAALLASSNEERRAENHETIAEAARLASDYRAKAAQAREERNFPEEAALLRACLKQQKIEFGQENPHLVPTIGHLASCYREDNIANVGAEVELALEIYRKATTKTREIVNKTNWATGIWRPLASACFDLSKISRSEKARNRYLQWSERFYEDAVDSWQESKAEGGYANLLRSYLAVTTRSGNTSRTARLRFELFNCNKTILQQRVSGEQPFQLGPRGQQEGGNQPGRFFRRREPGLRRFER